MNFIFMNCLVLFVILGVVWGKYTPPQAKVEPLYPKGLRVSIPDEEGISLVAFHIKFNEEFEGIEAGTIARDVLRVRNGRWKYEDQTTELKLGDKVYYWVHVVYQGLGYNLLFQEHEVTAFYNADGSRVDTGEVIDDKTPSPDENPECQISQTTIIDTKTGEQKSVCTGELVFVDEFNGLNDSVWRTVEQFSRYPDFPFVVYRNDLRNVKTERGNLCLIPTLLEQEYGRDFIRHGSLTLPSCTAQQGTTACHRVAIGQSIIPPVASGCIDTKNSFAFTYGKVEIRAKLPKGDWIYPVITLDPYDGVQDIENPLQLRIVESFGNPVLQTSGGSDVSAHVLSGGPVTKLTPNKAGPSDRPRRYSPDLWADAFHKYELDWRRGQIRVRVDDVEFGSVTVDSAFEKPFYVTLAVGVGGSTEFPDHSSSGTYGKPWKNVGSKALFDFFNSTGTWSRSWRMNDRDLKIDYIKITAL